MTRRVDGNVMKIRISADMIPTAVFADCAGISVNFFYSKPVFPVC